MSDEALPEGAIDLWPALHDAFLRKVQSDATASSVLVAVENADLNGFHGFPEGGEFELRFSGINSLEIVVSRAYGLVGEGAHRKRRHESGSWRDFEARFNDDHALFPHGRYEIYRAHVESANQMATLVMDVFDYRAFDANCDEFLTLLRLTSEAVEILDPSGRIHTVDSFLALGTAYWDDWRKRFPVKDSNRLAYLHLTDDATALRHADLLSRQPHPLAFVTLSGSHLYGFSSPDSDWDMRGVHAVPAATALGLDTYDETVEDKTFVGGAPIVRPPTPGAHGIVYTNVLDELVTHDARKYFLLLLKNNGYVLEQIFSPLVVFDGGRLDELRTIARGCITSHHGLHYKGFGYGEWTKFVNNPTKTVKRILYVFRVLLSGIHLMRTGVVEANILRLNEEMKLPYIDELIAQKRAGEEAGELAAGHGLDYYTREYERLMAILIDASDASKLPKEPSGRSRAQLNAMLLELRAV